MLREARGSPKETVKLSRTISMNLKLDMSICRRRQSEVMTRVPLTTLHLGCRGVQQARQPRLDAFEQPILRPTASTIAEVRQTALDVCNDRYGKSVESSSKNATYHARGIDLDAGT